MFLPQQLQRHPWPAQLAVDRRPIRLRPTILGRHDGRRVEPDLQRFVKALAPLPVEKELKPCRIRGSPNGARRPVHRLVAIARNGRSRSIRLVAINRNSWSRSPGARTGGEKGSGGPAGTCNSNEKEGRYTLEAGDPNQFGLIFLRLVNVARVVQRICCRGRGSTHELIGQSLRDTAPPLTTLIRSARGPKWMTILSEGI